MNIQIHLWSRYFQYFIKINSVIMIWLFGKEIRMHVCIKNLWDFSRKNNFWHESNKFTNVTIWANIRFQNK